MLGTVQVTPVTQFNTSDGVLNKFKHTFQDLYNLSHSLWRGSPYYKQTWRCKEQTQLKFILESNYASAALS